MSRVFVFGSNLAGRHGKGAALYALRNYGAVYGQGCGRQGDSFGIPTKDHNLKTLPLSEIKESVLDFLHYARDHPDTLFEVTAIGTGLAGYSHSDIAPMFSGASSNVILPLEWKEECIKDE